MSMHDKGHVMSYVVWAKYPLLMKYAEDHLDGDEAFELAKILYLSPQLDWFNRDANCISAAFEWAKSPQGFDYWNEIYNRSLTQTFARDEITELNGTEFTPGFIWGDAPVRKDWQPDEPIDDVMGVTKGMFE